MCGVRSIAIAAANGFLRLGPGKGDGRCLTFTSSRVETAGTSSKRTATSSPRKTPRPKPRKAGKDWTRANGGGEVFTHRDEGEFSRIRKGDQV
jgi:hypothetical protein